MKNFPPFHIIFKTFGTFFAEYDLKFGGFKIKPTVLVYSSTLTLTIQLFNLHTLTSDLRSNTEKQLFVNQNHAWLSKFVFTLDILILFALSVSTIVNILVQRKKQTKFLNSLVEAQSNLNHNFLNQSTVFERRIHKLTFLLIVLLLIGPALSEYINNRLANFEQWLYILSLYCIIGQFYVGHVFEFVLFEHLSNNFQQLLCYMKCQSNDMRKCITVHLDLWWISSKFTKLFELNKIFCLTSAKVLISIYWFYLYDLYQWSVLPPLIWQTMVSVILVTCRSWHRLSDQVSCINCLSVSFCCVCSGSGVTNFLKG